MGALTKIIKLFSDKDYRFIVLSGKGFYNKTNDERYLRRMFKIRMGYDLNLQSPQTFNEKIQWLKLYDRNSLYTSLADKYEVKKFIASIIGTEHIIPTIGVWNEFDEINFDELPNQFVLKCTHDSGGLVICRDKEKLDINAAKKKIKKSLKHNYFYQGREWPYKDIKPRIIAEKYMEDTTSKQIGLTDYKFFCFNGVPSLLYVSRGLENHSTAEISFYDMNGKELWFHREDYRPYHDVKMPSNFTEMKRIAQLLAEKVACPFVRVDLYSINGCVYFSEITFSPCGGMIPFDPKSADNELGNMLCLPIEDNK